MAVAEVALKHYKAAKDLSGIQAAITHVWTERHNFVKWWDSQEKDKGAAIKRGNRSVTTFQKLENFNLSKMVVSRWRQKCGDEEKLKQQLNESPDMRKPTNREGFAGTTCDDDQTSVIVANFPRSSTPCAICGDHFKPIRLRYRVCQPCYWFTELHPAGGTCGYQAELWGATG